ncbi:hypothetical protein [Marinicella gelatinilytica]|uniref:hypothetical protein n=1 Tax=Marinicella gelatinilytica TaxID=2996017 RepID=UPI002260F322|nr:hypothetical protein [Marinicella gelatinilytica]MCX7545435.1 hypothetical protein [Marinicella gelatinilytica]
MKLKEIVSCYQTKTYVCDKTTFDKAIVAFDKHANSFENDWRKLIKTAHKVVYKKGSPVALTFDYSSGLEVQVIFDFDSENKQMTVRVGNWGFPFEPLMAKQRYVELLDNIHSFIMDSVVVHEMCA